MTNDELKEFYHEKILKKCLHKYKRVVIKEYIYRECTKCDYCSQVHGLIDLEPMRVPDYLSDPAVILGIIKEHDFAIDQVYTFQDIITFGNEHDTREIKLYIVKQAKDNAKEFADESLERAVMMAYKAKHESKE